MDIADRIERRLEEARAALATDAREAVRQGRSLTDWRAHVRNHPWAAFGGATAIGFLLVPHRRGRSREADQGTPATEPVEYLAAGPGISLLRRCLDVAIVAAVEQAFLQFGGQGSAAPEPVHGGQPSTNGTAAAATEHADDRATESDEDHSSTASRWVAALEEPLAAASGVAKRTIADHPAESIAAATVVGLILGLLAKRR
jgi:ElaB/YqjD/DUF883 family membrane-anchored ribosome-binding protein